MRVMIYVVNARYQFNDEPCDCVSAKQKTLFCSSQAEPMVGTAGGESAETAAQHMDDLRRRIRLLAGDKRARIDVLESSKSTNTGVISSLSEANKELRKRLSQLQHRGSQSDAEGLAHDISRLRKSIDALHQQAKTKSKNVQKQTDDITELQLQAKEPCRDTSPTTRQIRLLENRLDKALIKFNEAQSIRKTYEQIVQRLKDERIGFDHQLAMLDRTYKIKCRDFEELLLLSGDANHAKDVAKTELEHVRTGYDDERRRRERELRERHHLVKLRKESIDRLMKQDHSRRAALMADDHTSAADDESSEHMHQAAENSLALSRQRAEQSNKIDIFEAAFRKIKEATGVSDVNEVIKKIVSQEMTTKNLMGLTSENQHKLERLSQQRSQLRAHVEEIKYAVPGSGHRRKLVDESGEKLAAANARIERSCAKYERLAKVLIASKAGVKHLQDKLAALREELGGTNIQLTDDTAVRMVMEIEKMMLEMAARSRIAAQDFDVASDPKIDIEDEDDIFRSRPYNQRIELPILEGSDDFVMKDGDLMSNNDFDDELTRDKVKRACTQVCLLAGWYRQGASLLRRCSQHRTG